MTQPSLEMWWGDGFDNAVDRERAHGIMHDAFEIANQGLERIDLEAIKKMRCIVHLTGPGDREFGEATGRRTMYLYIGEGRFNRRAISPAVLSDTVFHEGVHCLRRDVRRTPISLAEISAHEGLAYVAERQYRPWRVRQHGGALPIARSLVDKVKAIPYQEMEDLRRDFICDAFGANTPAAWDRWHFAEANYFRVGMDVIVGIASVLRHQRDGLAIADLIDLSPAEVLGIV